MGQLNYYKSGKLLQIGAIITNWGVTLAYSKDLTFYKYHNNNEFAKHSFYSKQNDWNEFKDALETF